MTFSAISNDGASCGLALRAQHVLRHLALEGLMSDRIALGWADIGVRIEDAYRGVDMVEHDDAVMQLALQVLDLARDLTALLDVARDAVLMFLHGNGPADQVVSRRKCGCPGFKFLVAGATATGEKRRPDEQMRIPTIAAVGSD